MSKFRPITSVEQGLSKVDARAAAATAALRRAHPPITSTSRLPDLPPLLDQTPLASTSSRREKGSAVDKKHEEVLVLSDGDDDDPQQVEEDEEMEEVDIRPIANARHQSNGIEQKFTADGYSNDEKDQMKKLDSELSSVEAQIQELCELRNALLSDRRNFETQIMRRHRITASSSSRPSTSLLLNSSKTIDYTRSDFEWSKRLLRTAKQTFGIESFRLCQEAAINASMSGREVMAVMPTGGGKSILYQLPAVLSSRGTTVVITPLISLMDDQCFNLKAKGVVAEMLNASTTSDDQRSIMKRLVGEDSSAPKSQKSGKGKVRAKIEDNDEQSSFDENETIKLIYVTPERIDKSKTFINTLQKIYDAGRLVRFVVDEAHCVSTLGHDFRTSYLALRRLKTLFPETPILATTATAPSKVVADCLKTLGLPTRTSPGDAAVPSTTVMFTSPLFRPNLRYQIRQKPSAATAQVQAIVDFILEAHPNDIGIVYCLSRTDTENVATAMNTLSEGKIRASIYHAGLEDRDKLKVQDLWRRKRISTVVATNASFGLGIDNPHVRYVIHHSAPKSLSNFYQESGRAGRDGSPSDCLLFWRPTDASRLSTMMVDEFSGGGKEKLYEMISFAEDLKTCRKLAFAMSFDGGAEASDRTAARFDEGPLANKPCGTCDNCLRDPSTINSLDVTIDAYRALRLIAAVDREQGTLTLAQACDLVRGLGKGAFTINSRGKNSKAKGKIDVENEAGSKVGLGKDETEQLIVKLLVEGYLKEILKSTGWSTNSYLVTTPSALRFTRLDSATASVEDGKNLPRRVLIDVRSKPSKKRSSGTKESKIPQKKRRTSTTVTLELGDDDEDEGAAIVTGDEEEEEEEERFDFQDEAGDEDPDPDELSAVNEVSRSAPEVTSDGWEVWR